MALKAGLVGVNPKGVDKNGMPIASGSADVEAEIQQINLDIAHLQASKVGIGQLEANNKAFHFAYDSTSEKYGYKLDGTGDFIPFESAGGGPGWNTPADLSGNLLTLASGVSLVEGGAVLIDDVLYVDVILQKEAASSSVSNFKLADFDSSVVLTQNGGFSYISGNTATEVQNAGYTSPSASSSLFANTAGSAGARTLNLKRASSGSIQQGYYHIWGSVK